MEKCKQCGQTLVQDLHGSWVDSSGGDGCDPADPSGIGSEVHIPFALNIGDRVIVRTDRGGRFTGIVERFERDGNRVVIRPIHDLVRAVFPYNYTLGRAHWNSDLEIII